MCKELHSEHGHPVIRSTIKETVLNSCLFRNSAEFFWLLLIEPWRLETDNWFKKTWLRLDRDTYIKVLMKSWQPQDGEF